MKITKEQLKQIIKEEIRGVYYNKNPSPIGKYIQLMSRDDELKFYKIEAEQVGEFQEAVIDYDGQKVYLNRDPQSGEIKPVRTKRGDPQLSYVGFTEPTGGTRIDLGTTDSGAGVLRMEQP
tara:strand:+ start:444 stop:806 length:363 start_codon:yes stop_codon:yes gene_type:complete